MSGKKWTLILFILLLLTLVGTGTCVYIVDPFFHYRAPDPQLYYSISDQRSQNDGITRNFEYDSIITGTSMSENFKTSLFDELFGARSVKLPYSGASYKEINDNLKVSYNSGHHLRYVFRPLDYTMLARDKDTMRTDMGEYPVWLTNDDPFDDIKYLLNGDVFLNYTALTLFKRIMGKEGGYTSFDDYGFSGDENTYSATMALSGRSEFKDPSKIMETTPEDLVIVTENVQQNVIALAREHPETTYLYFFPPYSMAYWGELREKGSLTVNIDQIEEASKLMVECDNIHLYCFGFAVDITSDLDQYKDVAHYSPYISDTIEELIFGLESGNSTDTYKLVVTKQNCDEYFANLRKFLENYDYNSLIPE